MEFVSLLLPLCGVILVIFLAYWATRFIAVKYKASSNGKYIKVLERTVISKDMFLMLVQMSDKVYMLSVSGQHTETICTIDASEIEAMKDPEMNSDFKSIFTNLLKKQMPLLDKVKVSLSPRGKKQ